MEIVILMIDQELLFRVLVYRVQLACRCISKQKDVPQSCRDLLSKNLLNSDASIKKQLDLSKRQQTQCEHLEKEVDRRVT